MQRYVRCFESLTRSIAACTLAALLGSSIAAVQAQETGAAPGAAAPESGPGEFYESRVLPILKAHCLRCHGGRRSIKGGLRLTSRDDVLRGGDTGAAVLLEKPAESLLLRAISYTDENLEMPPAGKLDPGDIAVLTQWVQMGLPWAPGEKAPAATADDEPEARPGVTEEARSFWSFRRLTRPAVPAVKHRDWVRNPIDAFILQRLEANGLEPAPPAEKIALLRRAYFNLTGLPPSPAEVESFLEAESPGAFDKVIDRLLASPRYGERWARHWLDVVRFAETNSFERDSVKPNAWRYRDYVVEAFNSDKPYDQFIREQLAGDEIEAVTTESIIATGYYRLGPWDDEPTDPLQARYDELDDVMTATGQGFLGLTMNCARCHAHKLDPIPHEDYYRLLAFFHGVLPTRRGSAETTQTVIASDAARKARGREIEALNHEKEEVRKRIADIEAPVLAQLTEEARSRARDAAKRVELVKAGLTGLSGGKELERYDELRRTLRKLERRRLPPLESALSVKEAGPQAPETHVLIRGNAHVKGDRVEPGFPSILAAPPAVIPPAEEGDRSSGRRLVLANWIASEENPLTARVMVNRIWQHHFGRGIVRTPNDFGHQGSRPTHPDLLDWLASEFMASGWTIKHLHRLIMTSNSYQMSSRGNAVALEKDPENDLFWRMDMRRLEAEEIRDAILATIGELNPRMSGPGFYTLIPEEVLHGQSRPGDGWGRSSDRERARRSIYIHVKRSLIPPLLSTFDSADTDTTCPVRFATTQPTQALTMLNSDFMRRQAAALAARLTREAGATPAAQVGLALSLALCRTPLPAEVARGVRLIDSLKDEDGLSAAQALEEFCLVVLNLNEFIYLD